MTTNQLNAQKNLSFRISDDDIARLHSVFGDAEFASATDIMRMAIRKLADHATAPATDNGLQSEYEALQKVNSELQTALDAAQAEYKELQLLNTTFQNENSEGERAYNALELVNTELQRENTDLQSVNAALQNQVNKEVNTVNAENAQLRDAVARSIQFTPEQMKLVQHVYDTAHKVNPRVQNIADVVFGVFANYCNNPAGRFATGISTPAKV